MSQGAQSSHRITTILMSHSQRREKQSGATVDMMESVEAISVGEGERHRGEKQELEALDSKMKQSASRVGNSNQACQSHPRTDEVNSQYRRELLPENNSEVAVVEEIRRIMLECIEENKFEQDDSIDQLLVKNQTMKDKLSIIVYTVEEQLAAMGHDLTSFFDSVDVTAGLTVRS